ncbi:MAG: hypothetical protein RR770_08155, partial [Bacteroidales bacterium]
VVLVLTGCSSTQQETTAKSCKFEVLSAQDDTLLKTIDDQDAVSKFLQTDEWEEVDKLPQDLVPEFKLDIYQEKTLLAGQDPNMEREYEIIISITTFKDSSYVEESISADMVKNKKISDEFLIFKYNIPDDIINELKQLLQ